MNEQTPHDWHDTLIDRGLAELVGGDTPPDLTERILAAVDSTQAEKVTLAEGTKSLKKSKLKVKAWGILAVAVSLCGVTIGLMLLEAQPTRETARRSTIQSMIQPNSGHNPDRSVNDSLQQTRGELILERSINDCYAGEAGQESVVKAAPSPPSPKQFPNLSNTATREKLGKTSGEERSHVQFSEKLNFSYHSGGAKQQSVPSPYYLSDDVQYNAGGEYGRRVGRQFRIASAPESNLKYAMGREGHEVARQVGPGIIIGEEEFERLGIAEPSYVPRDQEQFDEQGTGPGTAGDQYTRIHENPFIKAVLGDAVSTFSIDVDTASYANVRQFLEQSRRLPPPDAVRIEELVNYFDYNYEGPNDETPFAAHMEIATCPWNAEHRLLRIGIKGREIDRQARPQSNLVFLVDVSGSMNEPNKLPLLIEGMKLLTRELGENDKVAIVVYASTEGLALESTRGDQQQTILSALERLQAGGSTAGGAGIQLAYQTAQDNFIKGGVNRVILCTDGDFNVGVTSPDQLERMAEEKAKETGVFLTVLGFGRGNLNDAMMEAISGKGNGNYNYVDNLTEARKVLVEEMVGTLVTIAKDVKIQVEFNPAQVAGYRLIGYENRMLRTEDFNDDKKDAGEIGAGHTVTALYEIIPAGKKVDIPAADPLKYQPNKTEKPQASNVHASEELLTLKLRYKLPDGDTSTKVEFTLTDQGNTFEDANEDFRFASAVASFGMLLRNSEYRGTATYNSVLETASSASSRDPHGYRAEFMDLVRIAKGLSKVQN